MGFRLGRPPHNERVEAVGGLLQRETASENIVDQSILTLARPQLNPDSLDSYNRSNPLGNSMDHLEEHFDELAHLLANSRAVPFLGAGASVAPADAAHLIGGSSLPTGRELANELARWLGKDQDEIDVDDLLEVATCFALYCGRHQLQETLKGVFHPQSEPLPLHHFLAKQLPPTLLVTTNYDSLIERAFSAAGRDYHFVMTPLQDERVLWWRPGASVPERCHRDKLWFDWNDAPVIYKLHGGVDPAGSWIDSVVTEDDYFDIGGRVYEGSFFPPAIAEKVDRSHLLFLGYSMRDVHVRHFIAGLQRHGQSRGHFLVSRRITWMDRVRCDGLGIKCFEVTLDLFIQRLVSVAKAHGTGPIQGAV